jgi:hypothetical protein
MDPKSEKSGNLHITLATFTFLLHQNHCESLDTDLNGICEEIKKQAELPSMSDVIESLAHSLETSMGTPPTDETVRAFLLSAYPDQTFSKTEQNELGNKLVEKIQSELEEDADADAVHGWLQEKYGDRIGTTFGASRQVRIHNMRRYLFQSSFPWLAQIIDRREEEVGPQWVMVEQVTDTVTCMDPYPWDDIDEEFQLPIVDFLVRWELAGMRSFRITKD